MFLLLLVNFVSGVRLELMYSPHRKYQIKPHTSPWFAAASAAAIFHRDHFFCLHQQNKSSESKVKFRQASNCCKRVLKAVKLAYGNKTRVHYFPERWLLELFTLFNRRKVLSSAYDKAKLFAKTSLRKLILTTWVSLYLFSLLKQIWNSIIFL